MNEFNKKIEIDKDITEDMTFDPCRHCGSTKDTWFDRSVQLDNDGNELEYESFACRCPDCGKNVDAPVEYYKDKKQINQILDEAINEVEKKGISELDSLSDYTVFGKIADFYEKHGCLPSESSVFNKIKDENKNITKKEIKNFQTGFEAGVSMAIISYTLLILLVVLILKNVVYV